MEATFRLIFSMILVSAFLISGTFRRRARQSGDVIARQDEGKTVLFIRMVFAFPLLISLLLYIIYPQALNWSRFELPIWLRWVAVGTGVLTIPFTLWVFRHIGRNISETVLTKSDHELVKSGPYRWIRHPLYSGSLWMLFSISVIASNWFLLLYSFLGLIAFRWLIIPVEENQLVHAFGEEYREYQSRTGALFPKPY
jgi:protein-S-isoprenylcysteine O-methyltransferase Ste14